MKVNKFDISKPIEYGEGKKFWANVGSMTEFIKDDGSVSRIIEIHAIGLKASVFPKKPKNASNSHGDDIDTTSSEEGSQDATVSQNNANKAQIDTIEYPVEEISPEDIPF